MTHPHPADHEIGVDDDTPSALDDEWLDIEVSDEELDALTLAPQPRPKISHELAQKLQKARIMSAAQLTTLPPPEWFLEDLLPHAPRTMLHGFGGAYKSFLALDWMLCAATGMKWHEHQVRPGRVLYIAGEGGTGLRKRINAWCATHGLTDEDLADIDFMIDPINLAEGDHTAIWSGFFDWMQYDYVVIDTLHTASAGAEENSSTEMGKVLENATRMVGPDTSLFYVHHTTKSGKGHRGSGALRDDMDVVISLMPVEDVDLTAQLTADKIRDGEKFKPINVALSRFGEGTESSLYISSITENAKYHDHDTRPPSAIDKCMEAITEAGLDYQRGEDYISAALKELNLGYNFSPSRTVGPALKRLRGKDQEVRNMAAGKVEIELDEEDR